MNGDLEIDFRSKLREIYRCGFIKSSRTGDTGIGYTLEKCMGIPENNHRYYDFVYQGDKIEVKARRLTSLAKMTLFTKEPKYRIMNDRELINKYGYTDSKNRQALKIVFNAISENKYGLGLTIDIKKKIINLLHVKQEEVLWKWVEEDIQLKFINLLLVFANQERRSGNEYFHYCKAIYFKGFKENKFLELLRNGHIAIEFRMHIEHNGSIRNRGTAFRLKLNKGDRSKKTRLNTDIIFSDLIDCYRSIEHIN